MPYACFDLESDVFSLQSPCCSLFGCVSACTRPAIESLSVSIPRCLPTHGVLLLIQTHISLAMKQPGLQAPDASLLSRVAQNISESGRGRPCFPQKTCSRLRTGFGERRSWTGHRHLPDGNVKTRESRVLLFLSVTEKEEGDTSSEAL